jgi:hypothetical protein
MAIEKPTLSKPWADDVAANRADPGGVNDSGVPADGKSIPRRWLNWILNKVDTATRYLVARGVPDWDAAETYDTHDRVQSGGHTYRCRQASTNNEPSASPTYWEVWGYTATRFGITFTGLLAAAFPALFADAFAAQFPISMNGLTDTAGDQITSNVGTVSDTIKFSIARYNNTAGLRVVCMTVTDCGTPNGHFHISLTGTCRITGAVAWVNCVRDIRMDIFPRTYLETDNVMTVDFQNSSFASGPHPTVNVWIMGTPWPS